MNEHVLDLVKKCNNERDIIEAVAADSDPEVLYMLSPVAANLLEWYDFDPKGTALELSAGCGTITGMLCRRLAAVTAVEADDLSYEANAYRNRAYKNLTLVRDDAGSYDTDETFDYLVMVGILPYAKSYDDSAGAMLSRVRKFLKPGGKLFIALPNKYGLKYFAGTNEDYSHEPYGGFAEKPAGGEVELFSRKQLADMLDAAGYKKAEFYYPVPDYRLPLEIYSSKRLPGPGDLGTVAADYYNDRLVTLDEPTVYDSICRDGLYEDFANSFLIVAE